MASYALKSGDLNIFLSSGQDPELWQMLVRSLCCEMGFLWIGLYVVINIGFGNAT